MSATLRIRRMAETDAEVVAALAAELGYPSETEAIGVRIRAIGESDLLLVAVDASDKAIGFIQAHRVCIIEVGCGEHDLIEVAKQGLDAMQSLGATLVPTDT